MKDVLFKINKVSKRYGHKSNILDNISFEGHRNTVIGIIGPNGSGKTTLLSIIAQVIRPTSGSVSISIGNSIGATLGDVSFFSHLTAFENLEFIASLKQMSTASFANEITILLENVGLKSDILAKNFSYGMEQRYGIASALLASPDIILLDEPTNGIDPLDIEDVLALIKSSALDKCVLFSSHQIAEIIQIADVVLGLANGKLLFFESLNSLRMDAKTTNMDLKEYLLKKLKRS